MKRLIVVAAIVAGLVAMSFGGTASAAVPHQKWLSAHCGNFVRDDGPEGESSETCGFEAFLAYFFDGGVEPVCIAGQTYKFFVDFGGESVEVADAFKQDGTDAFAGSCGEPHSSDIYLCYSKSQVDPGAWPASEAADLIAQGYWQAYAVKGGAGSQMAGDYSLVCNPSGKTTGDFVDADGNSANDLAMAMPGALGTYMVST